MSMFPVAEAMERLPMDGLIDVATSSGKAFGQVDVRIVDEEGRDIPWPSADAAPAVPDLEEETGECWTRGTTVFNGYYNSVEATEATFHGGWFKTGDLVLPVRCAIAHPSIEGVMAWPQPSCCSKADHVAACTGRHPGLGAT